jgi:hypothetical protein
MITKQNKTKQNRDKETDPKRKINATKQNSGM